MASPAPYDNPSPAPYGIPSPANYGNPSPAPYGNPVLQQPGFDKGPEEQTGDDMQYLALLDTIRIHQRFQVIEVLTGFEQKNRYDICNANDQQFLFAQEENDCFTRNCFGELRPFEINISNQVGGVVMQLKRGLNCQGCCCPCCLQKMDIYYPMNQRVATIEEIWTCCVPTFRILNSRNEILFYIQGDCCYCKCCVDVIFRISTGAGNPCGEIRKHWSGFREVCGQVNDFSLYFPIDEPVENKAILLGAAFLIDYMFFEKKK